MFGKNKKEFKTEAELQRYIDLKINSTLNSLLRQNTDVARSRNESLKVENQKLHERIVHLEKYLGIEFGTDTVTGYKKIKKAKKK